MLSRQSHPFINHSPGADSFLFKEVELKLAAFDRITLQEMDRVMLFDRFDRKFLFPVTYLVELLPCLMNEYFALEVKDTRIHTYHTRYFDTVDFQHYLNHHNQRKSRYKFRHRIYVESDLHFFEIKEKNNKGRTVKSRINVTSKRPEIGSSSLDLIRSETGLDGSSFVPKLWSNFHRITLVHKFRQERMTIDMNLIVENENSWSELPKVVILELKQEKKSFDSPLVRKLFGDGIRPQMMSKYTYGVTSLYPGNKMNLFLPTVRSINKIIYSR